LTKKPSSLTQGGNGLGGLVLRTEWDKPCVTTSYLQVDDL
jgi:hypothetical protein